MMNVTQTGLKVLAVAAVLATGCADSSAGFEKQAEATTEVGVAYEKADSIHAPEEENCTDDEVPPSVSESPSPGTSPDPSCSIDAECETGSLCLAGFCAEVSEREITVDRIRYLTAEITGQGSVSLHAAHPDEDWSITSIEFEGSDYQESESARPSDDRIRSERGPDGRVYLASRSAYRVDARYNVVSPEGVVTPWGTIEVGRTERVEAWDTAFSPMTGELFAVTIQLPPGSDGTAGVARNMYLWTYEGGQFSRELVARHREWNDVRLAFDSAGAPFLVAARTDAIVRYTRGLDAWDGAILSRFPAEFSGPDITFDTVSAPDGLTHVIYGTRDRQGGSLEAGYLRLEDGAVADERTFDFVEPIDRMVPELRIDAEGSAYTVVIGEDRGGRSAVYLYKLTDTTMTPTRLASFESGAVDLAFGVGLDGSVVLVNAQRAQAGWAALLTIRSFR